LDSYHSIPSSKNGSIKLFFLDDTGSQEIMKVLPQGGFLLPVANANQKYIKIELSKLPSLLRM
jgi:hypothetical protein